MKRPWDNDPDLVIEETRLIDGKEVTVRIYPPQYEPQEPVLASLNDANTAAQRFLRDERIRSGN